MGIYRSRRAQNPPKVSKSLLDPGRECPKCFEKSHKAKCQQETFPRLFEYLLFSWQFGSQIYGFLGSKLRGHNFRSPDVGRGRAQKIFSFESLVVH